MILKARRTQKKNPRCGSSPDPENWPLLTIESPVAQWLEHLSKSLRVMHDQVQIPSGNQIFSEFSLLLISWWKSANLICKFCFGSMKEQIIIYVDPLDINFFTLFLVSLDHCYFVLMTLCNIKLFAFLFPSQIRTRAISHCWAEGITQRPWLIAWWLCLGDVFVAQILFGLSTQLKNTLQEITAPNTWMLCLIICIIQYYINFYWIRWRSYMNEDWMYHILRSCKTFNVFPKFICYPLHYYNKHTVLCTRGLKLVI